MQMNSKKSLLRKSLRVIRKNVENKDNLSDIIFNKLINSAMFQNADKIFSYVSTDMEVSTGKLIEYSINHGKKVAVPYCIDECHMIFQYIDGLENLHKNYFGIDEPELDFNHKADYDYNTLLIVPGLAFDKTGMRMGYGKGYYDRYISDFSGVSVGLGFEKTLVDALPHNEFDFPVDYVITERKIYKIKNKEE